jgi:GR25 family glycosyltransferase involved in LPS biosynthesis
MMLLPMAAVERPNSIPCFCINLGRSAHRWASMQRRLAGWPEVIRIEAVDGRTFDRRTVLGFQSAAICMLRQGRLLRPGEIANRLSHCEAYKQILSRNLELAVIFEDYEASRADFEACSPSSRRRGRSRFTTSINVLA